MNIFAQKIWKFEVYGPFGRVIESFPFGEGELHHEAAEKARIACLELNNEGGRAWVRLVHHA